MTTFQIIIDIIYYRTTFNVVLLLF